MPDCYTCHQEITFDKNIRSATGKQIPLWPDKLNAHGHDEDGNPIRQPLPPQYQQQQQQQQTPKQQYEQRVQNKLAEVGPTGQSQGGSYLDTKRTRVMIEDLTREVREIKEILNSRTVIDTNVYEGRMNMMFNAFSDVLGTTGTPASELLKQKQQRQSIIDQDTTLINHAKKADQNIITDESKQFELVDERIPDSQDELLASRYDDDNSNKGVIDED